MTKGEFVKQQTLIGYSLFQLSLIARQGLEAQTREMNNYTH